MWFSLVLLGWMPVFCALRLWQVQAPAWAWIFIMPITVEIVVMVLYGLWRCHDKVEIDDDTITWTAPNRAKRTLAWNEITRITDRHFPEQLQLHGINDTVVLRVNHHLAQFEERLSAIMQHTDWLRLSAPNSNSILPVTFRRSAFPVVLLLPIALSLATLSVTFLLHGALWLALLFSSICVLWLFLLLSYRWSRLTVDCDAVTIRYYFRTQRIPIDSIEDVVIAKSGDPSQNFTPTVWLKLPDGRWEALFGWRNGALPIYGAILHAIALAEEANIE